MKVDLTGAPPQTICEVKSVVVGGSWNRDGTIIFGSTAPGGVWRVSAAGGAATPLTVVDASRQEQAHIAPLFLPDGKHFVYLRESSVPENNGIDIGSLDAKPEQQGLKRLVATKFNPVIAPSPDPGAVVLLFLREDALLAQTLDLAKLEMTGDPLRAAAGLRSKREFGNFSASTNGVLVYQKGSIQEYSSSPLVWLDLAGTSLGAAGTEGLTVRLDPAAARVAVDRTDDTGNGDIWLYDFSRKAPTRLTTNPLMNTTQSGPRTEHISAMAHSAASAQDCIECPRTAQAARKRCSRPAAATGNWTTGRTMAAFCSIPK
jgi:eukaryotic-like serine/threonine-protein kinase